MKETVFLLSLWAVLVFTVQFLLCSKCRKLSRQLIPVYVIAGMFAAALLLVVPELANGSGGVAIYSIFAFILCIIALTAVLADGLAWAVRYWMIRPRSRI